MKKLNTFINTFIIFSFVFFFLQSEATRYHASVESQQQVAAAQEKESLATVKSESQDQDITTSPLAQK